MTSIQMQQNPSTGIVMLAVLIFYFTIKKVREDGNRVGYSEIEKEAHFNIMTLGVLVALVFSWFMVALDIWAPLYTPSMWDPFTTARIPEKYNYLIIILILLPIIVFVFLMALGKKESEGVVQMTSYENKRDHLVDWIILKCPNCYSVYAYDTTLDEFSCQNCTKEFRRI